MSQPLPNIKKQAFQQLRKQYPQKLVDIGVKQVLLIEWIKNSHLTTFHHIYQEQTVSKGINQQKVIDSSEQNQQTVKIDEKSFETNLFEAIKIIVQAYQKNQSIRDKYQFQDVEQMVEKTKLTLKQILKISPKQSNSITNTPSKIAQNHKISEKMPEPTALKKTQINSFNPKPNQQSPNKTIQSVSKPVIQQPKSNSLFVQKQKPISEENIFKGQSSRRPSSRLQNQKSQFLKGQKPKSSAKSNRSKKSRVSSKGINIEKKSEKLEESRLDVEQIENTQDNYPEINNYETDHAKTAKTQENILENNEQGQGNNVDSQQQQPESQTDNTKDKKIVFDQNQNPFHLPTFRLSNQRISQKKNPIQSILSNPFIKKAFTHLCKQSYIGGGKTFDQIAQSADIMTLNKWMIFCKQFDFVSKIKKKHLVDIFQQCAENKPHINQKQFLDALIIVQNKMKVDQEDFIRKQICLDSEFAFRQKVATFKVSFAGPKVNFFQQSTIKPLDKYYQNLRQQKYQTERQKQKQFILHQGRFKEDIQSQIYDRKNQRNLKKSHIMNSSIVDHQKDSDESKVQKKNQTYAINSPYLKYIQNRSKVQDNYSSVKNNHEMGLSKFNISRKIQPLTYSQLFTQKNSVSTRSFTNDKQFAEMDGRSGSRNLTELNKNRNTKLISQSQINQNKNSNKKEAQLVKEKSSAKTLSKKPEKAQQTKPQRQWVQQIKNWAQEFDKSESQESDDILREHLMNEKIKKNSLPEKMDLSRIAQEFRKDEKWLEQQDLDEPSEWQRETQLQATNKKQRFK